MYQYMNGGFFVTIIRTLVADPKVFVLGSRKESSVGWAQESDNGKEREGRVGELGRSGQPAIPVVE